MEIESHALFPIHHSTNESHLGKITPPSFNMAEYHQLFVGTERLRCPEILFQPSLTGEDQMGMMETLQYVLARYTPEQQ
ncbi:actin-related protein 5-like [Vanacampus margaritifer]